MNLDIFQKLDSVEIDTQQHLTPSDQARINHYEATYHDTLDQMNRLEAAIAPLTNTGKWLNHTIGDLRRTIRQDREQAARTFISDVTSYLSSTYKVSLESRELTKQTTERLQEEDRDTTKPVITLEEITTHLLDQLEGRTFYDVAVTELKRAFKPRYRQGIEPKGRIVRIPRYFYFEDHYTGKGVRLSYGSEHEWPTLQRALSHFENPQTTDTLPQINRDLPDPRWRTYHQEPIELGEYPLKDNKRLTSITLYKNGNIAIKFPTNQLAIDFCRTYDLTT